MPEEFRRAYTELLNQYLRNNHETTLYKGQQFSKNIMEQGIPPERIISYHLEYMKNEYGDLPEELFESFHFLLEVMMGYGFRYREHQSLLDKQIQLQSDIEVAASMQQTLLPEVPYSVPDLDLGIISEAAHEMSGDYYHFRYNPHQNYLGVAVADIIGKGIPAALCMSMIKYAIESLPEDRLEPHALLGNINRVVVKNVDPSMFITMLYGSYDLGKHEFQYATAGHEPALFYSEKEKRYRELTGRGLVLGLHEHTEYISFSVTCHPGDMIVLFSDGVTESLKEGRFITHDEFIGLIDEHRHLPVQQMVDEIHQELLAWSDFQLKDDRTIIILKRLLEDQQNDKNDPTEAFEG